MGSQKKPAARGPSGAARSPRPSGRGRKIRYAVIGQGYIAQAAVLPAFAHAKKHAELVALISDDPVKSRTIRSS